MSTCLNIPEDSNRCVDEDCEPEIIERTGNPLPDDADRRRPHDGFTPELYEEFNKTMMTMNYKQVRWWCELVVSHVKVERRNLSLPLPSR